VVDGSNLATEGRTLPSLAQLDEAVRAYAEEDPNSRITVVVDASFEHRIDEAEREALREAMLNGEVVSPPAGAIGRGDAFVLRIAERTGALVLSNDSFQEFHGEHPWLFNEGRLIGGKPVPGVGWIFTPRLPIRGAKSRAATDGKHAKKDPSSAPAKAAELAKAAKKAAKRTSKKAELAEWPITPAEPPPTRRGRGRASRDPALSSAISVAVAEALDPAHPTKPAKTTKATKAPKAVKSVKAPAEKERAPAAKRVEAPKKSSVTKKAGVTKKEGAAKKAAAAKKASTKATPTKATSTKATAIKKGAAPKVEPQLAAAPKRSKKRSPSLLPAVNEPLSFITFVAAFAVGSTVEGQVVSFTSHGAMVDVALPDGGNLHCYIPLSAMGDPPPTKAREVLTKGGIRPFVLAGLDPPRRVAELALPKPPAKKRRGPAKKTAKAATGR
jgi:hypothetical protein